MPENNVRICKHCLKLKHRIEDGKYNAKDKKWRDDDGLLWNGSTCGACNNLRLKEIMRKKRNAQTS